MPKMSKTTKEPKTPKRHSKSPKKAVEDQNPPSQKVAHALAKRAERLFPTGLTGTVVVAGDD